MLMVSGERLVRYPASLITFFFSLDMKYLSSRTNKKQESGLPTIQK